MMFADPRGHARFPACGRASSPNGHKAKPAMRRAAKPNGIVMIRMKHTIAAQQVRDRHPEPREDQPDDVEDQPHRCPELKATPRKAL